MNQAFYTVQDLMAITTLPYATITKAIKEGKLVATKRGNKYIIYKEDANVYLNNLKDEALIESKCRQWKFEGYTEEHIEILKQQFIEVMNGGNIDDK